MGAILGELLTAMHVCLITLQRTFSKAECQVDRHAYLLIGDTEIQPSNMLSPVHLRGVGLKTTL